MSDRIERGTGEIVGDLDQYVAFKGLIEGFFNNLDTRTLVDRAETALGHPVAIIDLGFYFIAESPSVRADAALHRRDDPSFLETGIASFLRRHYIFSRVRENNYSSAVIRYPNGSCIAATININPTSVFLMLVFSRGEELTKQDLINAKKAVQLLALQLQRGSAGRFYRPLHNNRMLSKLLDGEPVSRQDISNERLSLPWIDSGSGLRILVISDPRTHSVGSLIGALTQMLIKYVPINTCYLYRDQMLVFLDDEQYRLLCVESRRELEGFLSDNHLYGIVSRQFYGMENAAEEYRKTNSIIDINVRFHIHFSVHSEMNFRIVADMLNERYDYRDFCHPAFFTLMEHDARNHTEFTRTLSCYLAHPACVGAALERLHIGKSTLFYRLGKIREITGITLNDPDELFELQFTRRLLITMGEAIE